MPVLHVNKSSVPQQIQTEFTKDLHKCTVEATGMVFVQGHSRGIYTTSLNTAYRKESKLISGSQLPSIGMAQLHLTAAKIDMLLQTVFIPG